MKFSIATITALIAASVSATAIENFDHAAIAATLKARGDALEKRCNNKGFQDCQNYCMLSGPGNIGRNIGCSIGCCRSYKCC